MKSYTVAEAGDKFASIVGEVEDVTAIEFTRRGKPVAVLVSFKRYEQLLGGKRDFWDAYLAFRGQFDLEQLGIERVVFENVRDKSPGREVRL